MLFLLSLNVYISREYLFLVTLFNPDVIAAQINIPPPVKAAEYNKITLPISISAINFNTYYLSYTHITESKKQDILLHYHTVYTELRNRSKPNKNRNKSIS